MSQSLPLSFGKVRRKKVKGEHSSFPESYSHILLLEHTGRETSKKCFFCAEMPCWQKAPFFFFFFFLMSPSMWTMLLSVCLGWSQTKAVIFFFFFFSSCRRHVQKGGGSAAVTGSPDQRPCGDLCQQVQNRQLGSRRTCKCAAGGVGFGSGKR